MLGGDAALGAALLGGDGDAGVTPCLEGVEATRVDLLASADVSTTAPTPPDGMPAPTGQNPAVMNSALVPTDGLALVDDHHFQLDSQKTWTQNLLEIMKEAGWFPWAK